MTSRFRTDQPLTASEGIAEAAIVRASIARTIRVIRFVRGLLVAFTALATWTFVDLSVAPRSEVGGQVARPATIGMAALSAIFLVILAWRSKGDHRALALRTETVARWMVATGVTATFAVALSVRTELMMSFAVPGLYLILAAPSLMALVLLRQRLAALDIRWESARRSRDHDRDVEGTDLQRTRADARWLLAAGVLAGVLIGTSAGRLRRRRCAAH